MTIATPKLAVASVISVAVSLTIQAAVAQNLSTMLYLSTDPLYIDPLERSRTYNTYEAVIADVSPSSPTGLAANAYFSQVPRPKQLIVGRWLQSDYAGGLRGATGVSLSKTIAQWQAVTNGAFGVSIDGASVTQITGLNFAAVLDLNGVAAVIDAGLTGADCTYNANFDRFEFISHNTTGVTTSGLSYLSAPTGGGTDISGSFTLCSAAAAPAAYLYGGGPAETAAAAINTFDSLIGRKFYAASAGPSASDQNVLDFVAQITAMNNKHVYVHTTQDAAALNSPNIDTTSLAAVLHTLKRDRAFLQYSSQNAYAAISGFARLLTVDYSGSNTAITLKFKQEPGVVAENINDTQWQNLKTKGVNVFANYDNDTAILQEGTMSSGVFADQIGFADWFATTAQTAVWNRLYTGTRIPQTDDGMHELKAATEQVCVQAGRNGYIAAGTWQTEGFGTLEYGDFMPTGFYVYQGLVADQDEADRGQRIATPQQVALKLAGAVHSVNIAVTINP